MSPKAILLAMLTTFSALQGTDARTSEDLINPPVLNNAGRHLTQFNPPGPSQDACTLIDLNCCYSPTWCLPVSSAHQASSLTPEILLQACSDGGIGSQTICTPDCIPVFTNTVTCTYYENLGDYTGGPPCPDNTFNGQTEQVYNPADFYSGNVELVWEDAQVTSGLPTGLQTCDDNTGSYTLTATYSKSSSWNVGIQLGAKFLKDYEVKLTAGYSETYTVGQNAAVTVDSTQGIHVTAKAGTLVHHSIGWWDVEIGGGDYLGCSGYRIDNVASDLIMPITDPRFPTDLGADSRPCGYPLLDGKVS